MPHQTAHGDSQNGLHLYNYTAIFCIVTLCVCLSVCLQDIKSYWQNEPNYVDGKHKEDLVKDTEFGL